MRRIKIASSSDVRVNEMIPVECDGKKLLLARTEQGVAVLDRKCTHLGADLCKGKIEQGAIVCPWHGARFNPATGESVQDAKMLLMRWRVKPLTTYAVSEEAGDVFISVN
jgi:nitrite reductase/ring-hydroxylating ferredoxin subunit